MRIHTLLLLALGLCVGPAHMPAMRACSTDFGPVRAVRDAHIRSVVLEVIELSSMQRENFALCENRYVRVPELKGFKRNGSIMYAIMMPNHAQMYTTDELRGLVAHELGHVPYWGEPRGIDNEFKADKKAVEWVGAYAVVSGLRAALVAFDPYPLEIRRRVQSIFNTRVSHIVVRTSSR